MPRRPASLAPLAGLLTVVAWASAFVAIRHVRTAFSPGSLTLGRLVVGSLLLAVPMLRAGWVRPNRREWLLLLTCGLLWFGAYNVALNAAEQRIDAGVAAMLVNIGPVLIAVLAGWLLREGFPSGLWAGSVLALAGVVVIGVATSTGHSRMLGVLLCLVAAVTYAGGVVSQKPLLARLPPAQVTWVACTVGAVVTLPFAGVLSGELRRASAGSVLGLVYLGAVPTAAGFLMWAFALRATTAGRMGALTYLVPPLALLLGWALLGETPPAAAYAGGVLCLAGVALTRRAAPVRLRRRPLQGAVGPG